MSISSNAQYYYTGTSLLEFDEAGTNLTSKDIQVVDVVARGSVAETGYSSTQDLFDIENYAIGMVASGGFDLGPFYVPGLLHDAVKAIVKSAVPPDGLSYNDPSNAYMKFYNSGNSSVTVTIKQSWHSDFSTIQTAVLPSLTETTVILNNATKSYTFANGNIGSWLDDYNISVY